MSFFSDDDDFLMGQKVDSILKAVRRKSGECSQKITSKKACTSSTSISPKLWPGDLNENDSIFSDIQLSEDSDSIKSNQEFAADDLQCTQKFIEDVRQKTMDISKLDFSSIFHGGSQYHTREGIQQNRAYGKEASVADSHNLQDFSWSSQEEFLNDTVFPSKGPFYKLPRDVEKLIYKYKGIKDLYEWQKECLQLPAVEKRKNLLYALPTSGGKTLVAEILILREIICRNKNVLFILPYVSIVQEKVGAMSPFAINFDFLVEEYTAGKGRVPPPKRRKRRSLYIASIEKGAILFDSLIEADRANDIGLVVVDEIHLIGERGRGATLEIFLTKIMYLKAGIQIVGMSATIGNLPELSDFLNADVYTRGFRPVELKEYIKCGPDVLEINPKGNDVEDIFVYNRTVNYKYSSNVKKADPDHLAGLVSEVIPDGSCLVFCSSRKNCENVAVLLSKILPKKYLEHRKEEKLSLMGAIEKLCGTLSSVLKTTIPCGIAYHHSGLTTDERKLLETAYRFGTISVICCTSTLAAGVNLPAKRVIIRAPYVGAQFMTLCQYKQMVGRAGRTGLGDAGESILICSSKDNLQVAQMLFSPMDKVVSSLDYQGGIGLQSLIMSAIGLNLANCLKDVIILVSNSLLAVQTAQLETCISPIVTQVLRDMFKHKVLQVSTAKDSITPSQFVTTQEIRERMVPAGKHYVLNRSTKFELTTIGRASFKAGIDYKKAESIFHELKEAQKSLVLTNFTHLLYLVVSFHLNDEFITPDPSILFREYNNIDKDTIRVANLIGITEVHVMKVVRNLSIKGPMEVQLSRLFRVFILSDVINIMPLHEIANKYSIERGIVQSLITQSLSATSSIIRLCEQVDFLWCFKSLFETLLIKLDHCCTIELEPLLQLPAVKVNRARQLYAAGFKTIEDIAKAKPRDLAESVEYMPHRTAREIISAAKVILLNKLETLQEETEIILECLQI